MLGQGPTVLEEDGFDHVLVDCRPALEVDTDNVLLWASDVLIPADVDRFSIGALELLLGQVATLVRETRIEAPRYRGLAASAAGGRRDPDAHRRGGGEERGADDIVVSSPDLRTLSTSSTPPACETTAPLRPERGHAGTTR